MSKRYEILLTAVVPDSATAEHVGAAALAAAEKIAALTNGTCSAVAEPKRTKPPRAERLRAADAFAAAFPEVCELTLSIGGRFVTLMRSVPGRWWIESRSGSRTTLSDCLADALGIEH